MTTWQWRRGTLAPSELALPDEDEISASLTRLGYHHSFALGAAPGDDDGFEVTVFTRTRTVDVDPSLPAAFLVELNLGGAVDYVSCQDLAAVLSFLRHVAPLATAAAVTFTARRASGQY